MIKRASIRPLVAAGGGQAFQQQAGERRGRAFEHQLAAPPVATRNGLACLLLESAILTHIFCYRAINSTFKTNHFLGYTFALNRLDGVYYVDPRPEMMTNERLREQIHDFQQFLVRDLWTLARE